MNAQTMMDTTTPTPEDFSLTEFDMVRWNSHARPLPLPQCFTPTGGAPLADIPDEVLMNAPPQLIVHMQRTAAQGGLQIISPRQVPFSQLMLRTHGGNRVIGDHVVGSIANPDDEWPTIDDTDFSHLLPDEPLAPRVEVATVREKTRTAPLTSASHEMVDPIVACLVKGRAVIDVLRRDDVQGGADEYTEVLAAAWGIDKEDIEDLDAFSLGVQGPLLRHAIKADEVYPMYYAPIHMRKCISVGASDVNRSYLPEDSAMDWRRMRVHCEAVFALTCMIEGLPVKLMRCIPPPGDMGAPSNRPNVMCFQPAPATAWTFQSDSFSIVPNEPQSTMKASAIPAEVLAALARHVRVVRPVSFALAKGYELSARRTTVHGVSMPRGETITSGYLFMVKQISLGGSRGKIAAAAIRNMIYTTIEAAPLHVRLRISRYIKIAREECRIHFGMTDVPDGLISKLADRFLTIGDTIRLKVVGEAALRGHTVEDWWADITAQAPQHYKDFVEGTKGWANVAMYLVFKEPTDKWTKLARAMNYSALRSAQVGSVGGMCLPAIKGSPERLVAAARGAVTRITSAYCGYYKGVADVGRSLADIAMDLNRPRTAEILKEASYMWVLRARCFRGTNVELLPHGETPRSANHYLVEAKPMNVVLVPAPYKGFMAYKAHVARSLVLRSSYKSHIARTNPVKISSVFAGLTEPLVPATESVVTRYVLRPWELHNEMESAWRMLCDDVLEIGRMYGAEPPPDPTPPQPKRIKIAAPLDLSAALAVQRSDKISYWDILAMMDEDEVAWIEDLFERMGEGHEELYSEREYESAEELRAELQAIDAGLPSGVSKTREVVR